MTLYRGRIDGQPDKLMDRINRSLPIDIRLLPYDLRTNRAWAGELTRIGILDAEEEKAINAELERCRAHYEQGHFLPLPPAEDVHSLVEKWLTDNLGTTGAKIHTGRSRNDQVACDLNLYLLDALGELARETATLGRNLADLTDKHAADPVTGTTHLQPAQPITLGHFFASLGFGLARDAERLLDARRRSSRCPLGCGALAGSGFPVDRKRLARDLGFNRTAGNAMDAIGDRDTPQEAAGAALILALRLSRYAEQFIIWSNPTFGYIRFSDHWSTGSSMMPQKRNPDAMELVRGKSASILGRTTALLALTKGLVPSYSKDLQEDKENLFAVLDDTLLSLRVFQGALGDITIFPNRMKEQLTGEMLATDLADRLAAAGVPFRQAHERVGRYITGLEDQNGDSDSLSQQMFTEHFPELTGQAPLDFSGALNLRSVIGGTAPEAVQDQAAELRVILTSLDTRE